MPNVLIGPELSGDLFRIAAQLRYQTVHDYNAIASAPAQWYSPWLSLFPRLPEREIPGVLLQQPVFVRGGLVTDEAFLAEARAFMEPRTELTRNGILDQKHVDWIPTTQVSQRQVEVFDEGRTLLLNGSAFFGRLYMEFVDYVLPLAGSRNRGYSSHVTRGVIFRSIPEDCDKHDVAIDLAHELGHQCLMVLQSVDEILISDPRQLVYSQIRKTLRPAIQTFHAAVALAFMHLFVVSRPDDPDCQAAGERRGRNYSHSLKHSLRLSLDALARECRFTPLGWKLMEEMAELT